MQVLGVSLDDVCFKRRYLSRSHVRRLLRMPTLHESLAPFTLSLKFHELYYEHARDMVRKVIEMKGNIIDPICLEEIDGKEEKVVACEKWQELHSQRVLYDVEKKRIRS